MRSYRWDPVVGLVPSKKRKRDQCSLSPHYVKTQRKGAASKPERVFTRIRIRISGPPGLWETNVCCLSRSVYSMWLWWPELTRAKANEPSLRTSPERFPSPSLGILNISFPQCLESWGMTLILPRTTKWGLVVIPHMGSPLLFLAKPSSQGCLVDMSVCIWYANEWDEYMYILSCSLY